MIYQQIDISEPIRQGDIFRDLPIVDLAFGTDGIPVKAEKDFRMKPWKDVLQDGSEKVAALLTVRRTFGIVITQNCDMPRDGATKNSARISLAVIEPMSQVINLGLGDTPKIENWVKMLMTKSREGLRWFYLPSDGPIVAGNIGFKEKMAADFRVIFSLRGADLNAMKELRIGKLDEESNQHFRETLGQYYRRYPYDEWYPLNHAEFEAYKREIAGREGSHPRAWQIPPASESK